MQAEEWRTAPGHSDYEVSNHGRVRRVKAAHSHLQWRVGTVLKGNKTKGRYLQVQLNGKPLFVHRLVATAFHGLPPDPNAVVMHIDEDAELYNAAWNLKWGTTAENIEDWIAKKRTLAGSRNGNAKLTEDDIRAIRSSSETQRSLASKYRVSRGLISMIKNGKAWAHVPMTE